MRVILIFFLLYTPKGREEKSSNFFFLLLLKTFGSGHCETCFTIFRRNGVESHIQHSGRRFWINFRGKCFSSHRHAYNTPFKMGDGRRKLMFFLAAETQKALWVSRPLSLTHSHLILSSSTDPHRHPF